MANPEQLDSDNDGTGDACDPDDDNDTISDAEDACPGTVIPEAVPTVRLGVNRFALTDNDTLFDTTPPQGKGPYKSFTLEDTAGGVVASRLLQH